MQFSLPNKTSERGFALIATISILVLLALISVGLLSLSSVTIRASTQSKGTAEAQANARLALMMAIGELQRELGPDSRISAPHDAGSLSGGSPHWTAVYDAWSKERDGLKETPDSRGVPQFRGWLVSGANQSLGGPAGTAEKVKMVAGGTLGNAAGQSLSVSVPMLESKDPKARGNFAWWVSDEGTKAKINAGPDRPKRSSFGLSDSIFHSQSPPSPGHQVIDALEKLEWEDPDEDAAAKSRGKAISKATVSFAEGVDKNKLGAITHDYTVYSAGVLSDVRAGRLKRDLSNLLSRDISESEDIPLYLADGRMNSFRISDSGSVTNSSIVKSWKTSRDGSSQWGINMEELHLFHDLPNVLSWARVSPALEMTNTREGAVNDRHYIYKRPATQALQFIFSFEAVPSGGEGKYKMIMKMDAMVAIGNPNDVQLVVPSGLNLDYQLSLIPYELKWNIKGAEGGVKLRKTSKPPELKLFKGRIEGNGNAASDGFVLRPGEAAVFGSSTGKGHNLDLKRGFIPSGGIEITSWDLKASDLSSDDEVDFKFTRTTGESTYGWAQFNAWIGGRDAQKGWQMDRIALRGGGLSGELVDETLPSTIRPSQVRPVDHFTKGAVPVLKLSFFQNVERPTGGGAPDAFASRPYQLGETPISDRNFNPSNLKEDRHAGQGLIVAESANFEFKTLAAGDEGENIYIGGGRQPNVGGSFHVIKRRIPLAAPLSLGAFQYAIASGFTGRFGDSGSAINADPIPKGSVAFCGKPYATPLVSHAIGDSHGLPQLEIDEVFSTRDVGAQIKVSTDHSWMINTALWDSWFLSGIVDGSGVRSSAWMKDRRSPRDQFIEFARGEKHLRNKRFIFHPFKSPEGALEELFSGNDFKDSAINLLPKYLLVDGAFNVNSTSENAWSALLASMRNQSLLTSNGSARVIGRKDVGSNPLGTLGYAANEQTTGVAGDWKGVRDLTDVEIKALAKTIVSEVKARGPFLSMADFVNRRPNAENSAHQALGALQAAINKSGVNDRLTIPGRKLSEANFDGLAGVKLVEAEGDSMRAIGSIGHLSQADLLTSLGPQISVRSDTFVIRAYGDSRDASGAVVAKAWCEAVVQRLPEYVNPVNNPEDQEGWPNRRDKLDPINVEFGRRFVIDSFRWLSESEV